MPYHEECKEVPWSPEQMFDLVLDVERYPEFVPGYQEARVEAREDTHLLVRQRIGFGAAATEFRSSADFQRPRYIRIRAHESPFDILSIDWEFVPTGPGCRVVFKVEFKLGNGLADRLLQPWLDAMGEQLPAAFARRARELYNGGMG